ncbi:saccharopine dehydrogenase-like oxidoreductase [Fopius arisanus]|uniref:Saccharopine dehydrogenase-like oxidoreductase n=1 Tax=Fopius arisanus TaxID=64838 RepID=A0A9R1U8P6_9HYME|nr:PREDICTED: saccharopine dehydrogenase-like oxidoreductase [Fopius arisanus]
MSETRLSLIIFGATGFTGKYTVKEAHRLSKTHQFTWGIAGRSKERLEAVLKEFAPDADNVPIITADIKDDESLKKMAEQARVIVNCCGPYRFYGEPVVKACIAAKTHQVDITGEPQYMERIQLEYHEAAQKAGVYIISACGFDSIPCDLGVIFTQQKFQGEVNSIESYLNSWADHNLGGPSLHYGTWESAVYGLAHADELRGLRSKLYPKRLPPFEPRLKARGAVHSSNISEGYSVVFPGSDRSVVYRTQRYLYENDKIRPVQIQTYMTFKSLLTIMAITCLGTVFSLMTKCKCGRTLLLKYPKFFSGGFVSNEGPLFEAMDKTFFSITFKAQGWTEKLAEPTDKHSESPNKEMITKVSGRNAGYGATCTMVMMSALMILEDGEKMPESGGVFPPGAAFAKTSIIDELNKNGVTFEVVSSKEK